MVAADRRAVRGNDARRLLGVEGEQDRDRPRRGDHDVVAEDRRTFASSQKTSPRLRASRTSPVAAQPPTRAALAQTLEFEGAVVGEVADVVRTSHEGDAASDTPVPNGR
jgi:hypothetical protein